MPMRAVHPSQLHASPGLSPQDTDGAAGRPAIRAGHPVSVCPGTPGMNSGSSPSPASLESRSPRALSESSAAPPQPRQQPPGHATLLSSRGQRRPSAFSYVVSSKAATVGTFLQYLLSRWRPRAGACTPSPPSKSLFPRARITLRLSPDPPAAPCAPSAPSAAHPSVFFPLITGSEITRPEVLLPAAVAPLP